MNKSIKLGMDQDDFRKQAKMKKLLKEIYMLITDEPGAATVADGSSRLETINKKCSKVMIIINDTTDQALGLILININKKVRKLIERPDILATSLFVIKLMICFLKFYVVNLNLEKKDNLKAELIRCLVKMFETVQHKDKQNYKELILYEITKDHLALSLTRYVFQ